MKLVASVAVAGLTFSLLAPAARAETRHVRDAHGDLNHGADIWRGTVEHESVVRVRVKHANLRRFPKRGAGISIYFDTNPTLPGPEYVIGSGLNAGTDYLLGTVNGWDFGEPVECRYRLSLDFDNDVTRTRFNRNCFGAPEAVRVAIEVGADGPGGTVVRDWLKAEQAFTPWVAQG
ncbi:MAG TPA: hypothetical protein VLI04_13595 [Nocardioidaceae bacterium]|nr:hypothetical protein [Nocardioidaceae bacterium]